MRVFAYCAKQFEESARRASGVTPLTCPPMSSKDFDPAWLQGYDLIYFDLHSYLGGCVWYGDKGRPALKMEQILDADLRGSVIFGLNCFLGDQGNPKTHLSTISE